MTHFYIGLFHNSKKKKKNTFIGNTSRDFQYDVGKKYAPNCANWVQKFKNSQNSKFCNPRQGASPLEPPSLVNNLGPPFPAAGSTPAVDLCTSGVRSRDTNVIVFGCLGSRQLDQLIMLVLDYMSLRKGDIAKVLFNNVYQMLQSI